MTDLIGIEQSGFPTVVCHQNEEFGRSLQEVIQLPIADGSCTVRRLVEVRGGTRVNELTRHNGAVAWGTVLAQDSGTLNLIGAPKMREGDGVFVQLTVASDEASAHSLTSALKGRNVAANIADTLTGLRVRWRYASSTFDVSVAFRCCGTVFYASGTNVLALIASDGQVTVANPQVPLHISPPPPAPPSQSIDPQSPLGTEFCVRYEEFIPATACSYPNLKAAIDQNESVDSMSIRFNFAPVAGDALSRMIAITKIESIYCAQ